jgi:anaerobic ribonucleoside-triphosphate reductase
MIDALPAEPTHLIKRDGGIRAFDPAKISGAIERAGRATGEFDAAAALRLVQDAVLPRVAALGPVTPHVEQIQDIVEAVLYDAGHRRTLRAYVVYREQHRALRDTRRTLVDVEASVCEYLQQRDWRVNANANQGYSLGGLILNVSGKVIANYWLDYVYPPEVGRAHREADLHIHDLDMLSGYCAGWSLRTLLHEGLNGVPGKVEAGPAKHLSSAVGQIVNFLGTLQNEWAGAQAFSSFDTYLAPFVRKDALSYAQVRQCLQELIYNLNVPSRWGTQTPFTNLTFDWVCPEDLREQVPVIGGGEMPFCYGELQAEMDMINRAYIEVMMAGDAKGRTFTFPIPTYNITRDFDWTSANAERLFEMTARYGLPYFQNFVNSDLEPHMVRSINEMIRNFSGDAYDLTDARGHALAVRLLDHVRERMVQFQQETGHLYNLEATPAEGTTYRFAKEDRKRFPDILQAGTAERPYYTNSSQLPVGFTDDPFEALERQDPLQRKYTGGTVLHLYMNEPLSSAAACRELVRRALSRFRLPYLTVTPTFSICPAHGYLGGHHEFCPKCDAERLARKQLAIA